MTTPVSETPLLTLAPGITVPLDNRGWGGDYLRWLERMIARPSQELWEARPWTGETVWEDDRWQLQLGGPRRGNRRLGSIQISLPMTGSLLQEYHRLVVDHQREMACHDRVTRLSEITDSYPWVTYREFLVDRPVGFLVVGDALRLSYDSTLGEDPLPEILSIIGPRQLADGHYRARSLIRIQSLTGRCSASVIYSFGGLCRPEKISCQHLVIDRPVLDLVYYDPAWCQCQLLTFHHHGRSHHYQLREGQWQPVQTEEIEIDAAWVAGPDDPRPRELMVTPTPEAIPGYMLLVDSATPSRGYPHRRVTAKSARSAETV